MTNVIMSTDISNVNEKHNELHEAFLQIFQGRSNFQLDNFVVGMHMTPERQYAQCVLELQHKYYNLRRGDINRRKLLKEIEECKDEFEKEEKILDLEQVEIAIIGALREFDHLYSIFKAMPKFSAEEMEAGENKYWIERLAIQAQIDIEAHGAIGTGNAEALRQVNLIKDYAPRFFESVQNHPGLNKDKQNEGLSLQFKS